MRSAQFLDGISTVRNLAERDHAILVGDGFLNLGILRIKEPEYRARQDFTIVLYLFQCHLVDFILDDGIAGYLPSAETVKVFTATFKA